MHGETMKYAAIIFSNYKCVVFLWKKTANPWYDRHSCIIWQEYS